MRTQRRAVGMVVSAAMVLAPAGAAVAAALQAGVLVRTGAAATTGADALLLLACVGAAVVLAWATAAAAAGVREGWRTVAATTGPALVAGTVARQGTAARSSRPEGEATATGGRPTAGHVLAATVAAVVVAALSATPAVAATPAPTPPAVQQTTYPDAAPSPGTWAALADPAAPSGAGAPRTETTDDQARDDQATDDQATDHQTADDQAADDQAFRAPRAVDPAAVALVTATPSRPGARGVTEVVVHTGDTLWDLAAARLGPGATDDEVARAWPAWWQANRSVIGDDPDLLLPGQRLVVPTP